MGWGVNSVEASVTMERTVREQSNATGRERERCQEESCLTQQTHNKEASCTPWAATSGHEWWSRAPGRTGRSVPRLQTLGASWFESGFLTHHSPQAYNRPDVLEPTSMFLVFQHPLGHHPQSQGPGRNILECKDRYVLTGITGFQVIVPQNLWYEVGHRDIIRPRQFSSKNDDFSSPWLFTRWLVFSHCCFLSHKALPLKGFQSPTSWNCIIPCSSMF